MTERIESERGRALLIGVTVVLGVIVIIGGVWAMCDDDRDEGCGRRYQHQAGYDRQNSGDEDAEERGEYRGRGRNDEDVDDEGEYRGRGRSDEDDDD
ncbi:MAG TPA: hypothetical protein PKM88_07595, partial [bacterium]|nr:hypothetical protein [bacterium]